jgi:hypothetical protein
VKQYLKTKPILVHMPMHMVKALEDKRERCGIPLVFQIRQAISNELKIPMEVKTK